MSNNVLSFNNDSGFTDADFKNVPYDKNLCKQIVDEIMSQGIRKQADIIDYAGIRNFAKSGGRLTGAFSNITDESVAKAEKSRNRDFNFQAPVKKEYNFTTAGSPFLINGMTLMIGGVMQEVYDTSADTALTDIFPAVEALARRLSVSIFAAPGGLADPYTYGTAAKEVPKIGNRTQFYSGIPYRNFMKIDEEEATFWYEIGNPDLSARGLLQRLTMYAMQAKVLMNNRINLIRASIFNNGISYYNNNDPMTTVSYQIPVWNFVKSITDPVNGWGTIYTVGNVPVANPNSNPLVDLMYLAKAAPALISRLGRVRRARMIMSPIMEMLFLANPNVQNKISIIQAAPGSPVNPRGQNTIDFLIKSQIPGVDFDIYVDSSGYLTKNSDVTWNPDGSGFVNDVNGYVPYNYFIPPDSVLFVLDVEDKGGNLGEFVFTAGIQNGGFRDVAAKPWFIIEDLSLPGTRGGPANPYMQLNFGFAGMLAVYHPEAVIIGKFANIVNSAPPAGLEYKSFVLPQDSGNYVSFVKDGDEYTETTHEKVGKTSVVTDKRKISKADYEQLEKGEK